MFLADVCDGSLSADVKLRLMGDFLTTTVFNALILSTGIHAILDTSISQWFTMILVKDALMSVIS